MQQANNFIVLNILKPLVVKAEPFSNTIKRKLDARRTISKESEPHELVQLLKLIYM